MALNTALDIQDFVGRFDPILDEEMKAANEREIDLPPDEQNSRSDDHGCWNDEDRAEQKSRRGELSEFADSLVAVYDAAMTRAGFDFAADSETLMDEYIIPAVDGIKAEMLENDKKALDIYRESGLDEIKVRWRSFDTARLSFFQQRKIRKIADQQELLGDVQLHFALMRMVILLHRPDLKEKYKEMEILTLKRRRR